MPRIPDETIERLKREVSLERLAEARGVKLVRLGPICMVFVRFMTTVHRRW